MREIIFRGKRVDYDKWVYGCLLHYNDGDMFICTEDYIPGVLNKYEVDPATVGEYTGLMDKNGVKIFEGDIVKTLERDAYGKQRYFPVVCVKGAAWLYDKLLLDNGGLDFLASYKEMAIEVIGNVWDNAELLEGDDEK